MMEYLKLLPGDKVKLTKGNPAIKNHFVAGMHTYVGKTTTIKEFFYGQCGSQKVPKYYTHIDDGPKGNYYWAISDFDILSNMRNINHPYYWAKKLNKLPAGMY